MFDLSDDGNWHDPLGLGGLGSGSNLGGGSSSGGGGSGSSGSGGIGGNSGGLGGGAGIGGMGGMLGGLGGMRGSTATGGVHSGDMSSGGFSHDAFSGNSGGIGGGPGIGAGGGMPSGLGNGQGMGGMASTGSSNGGGGALGGISSGRGFAGFGGAGGAGAFGGMPGGPAVGNTGPRGPMSMSGHNVVAEADQRTYTDPRAAATAQLIARGWAPHQAAGMAGSLYGESGMNPMASDYATGAHRGLGQWDSTRQASLANFTGQGFGGPVAPGQPAQTGPAFRAQVDFVDKELRGQAPGYSDPGAARVGQAMMNNPGMTIAQSARQFTKGYERPSTADLNKSLPGRVAAGREALNAMSAPQPIGGQGIAGGSPGLGVSPAIVGSASSNQLPGSDLHQRPAMSGAAGIGWNNYAMSQPKMQDRIAPSYPKRQDRIAPEPSMSLPVGMGRPGYIAPNQTRPQPAVGSPDLIAGAQPSTGWHMPPLMQAAIDKGTKVYHNDVAPVANRAWNNLNNPMVRIAAAMQGTGNRMPNRNDPNYWFLMRQRGFA